VFDWLFEGRAAVYVVLAALAAFLFVVWWQRRKRWCLIAVAILAALIGLYALLDKVVETDREQIVRKVQEMAAAVNARNLDALFVHISDQFRSRGGKSKDELRSEIKGYLDSQFIEKVKVWDIVCEERPSRDKATVRVFFSAKAEGARDLPHTACDAVFDFTGDDWRLQSIRLLNPLTGEEWPQQP
jgi:hypothetical protein